jgi:hypothetical protein
MGLRITELSDREMLHAVNDAMDDQGRAKTPDIAIALGMDPEDPHATRCVGSRMAYMRRCGFVNKTSNVREWTMTKDGKTLMNGEIPDSVRAAIDSMDFGGQVSVLRQVTRAGIRKKTSRFAVKREFTNVTANGNGRRR